MIGSGGFLSQTRKLVDLDHQLVIGVGTQKCGTTSIFSLLKRNGLRGRSSRGKELHEFSAGRFTTRGRYLRSLGVRDDGFIYGEFTPNYAHHPTAIWNLSKIVPEAKLIVSIRDPIDRAFSAYQNAVALGAIPSNMTFEQVIREARTGVNTANSKGGWTAIILKSGIYYPYLQRIFSHFDRERVLVVDFSRIKDADSKADLASELISFAGLVEGSGDLTFPELNTASNHKAIVPTASTGVNPETRLELQEYFEHSKTQTQQLIGLTLDWW